MQHYDADIREYALPCPTCGGVTGLRNSVFGNTEMGCCGIFVKAPYRLLLARWNKLVQDLGRADVETIHKEGRQ